MIDAKILVIDDNKSMLSALEILLQFEYKHVATLNNPKQIPSYQGFSDIDIVLLDMNFSAGVNSGNEGLCNNDDRLWLHRPCRKGNKEWCGRFYFKTLEQ